MSYLWGVFSLQMNWLFQLLFSGSCKIMDLHKYLQWVCVLLLSSIVVRLVWVTAFCLHIFQRLLGLCHDNPSRGDSLFALSSARWVKLYHYCNSGFAGYYCWSVTSAVYLVVDSGGTAVLVSQDGIQRPPLRFPKGGHLLQFLSCLENGLLPHGQLDPPLWLQRGKVSTEGSPTARIIYSSVLPHKRARVCFSLLWSINQ